MTEVEKQTKTANMFFTPKGTFRLCTKSLELGVAVRACDPRPEEAEERRSTTSLRPGLHSKFWGNKATEEDFVSIKEEEEEEMILGSYFPQVP